MTGMGMLMFTPTTVGGSFLSACNNVLAAADPRSEPISPERTYVRIERASTELRKFAELIRKNQI
jgi:hypothetical protein